MDYGLFAKGALVQGFQINKSDDSYYVGTFKNGKKSGKGVKWYPDGSKYEGEW